MKIVITHPAKLQLKKIFQYYNNVANRKIAYKITEHIIEAIQTLHHNPTIGQEEEYLKVLKKHHRRLIVGHYKIIYRKEKQILYITDIFDSRQDPSKMKK